MEIKLKGTKIDNNGNRSLVPLEPDRVSVAISNYSQDSIVRTHEIMFTIGGESFVLNTKELEAGLTALRNTHPNQD